MCGRLRLGAGYLLLTAADPYCRVVKGQDNGLIRRNVRVRIPPLQPDQGVAQMEARSVRDAEDVSSNLTTLTTHRAGTTGVRLALTQEMEVRLLRSVPQCPLDSGIPG